jgi:hypothetical protein
MRQRIGKNVATATLMLLSSAMVMAQSNTFSCSSDDGKRHTCTANGNSAIQFVRQRSQSPCIQGRTYGIDRGSVWVTNGCRADFAVSNYGITGLPTTVVVITEVVADTSVPDRLSITDPSKMGLPPVRQGMISPGLFAQLTAPSAMHGPFKSMATANWDGVGM